MTDKPIAKYKCFKCGFVYYSLPGPTECPKCHNLYIKWLNYHELKKEYNWSS